MIRNGRTVTLGDTFVQELERTEKYVGRTIPGRGRKFVSDVSDFLFETLAPLPLAYPAYVYQPIVGMSLRRAIFRKEYVIFYGVSDTEVSFVFFHHSSRNSPDLSFLDN